MTDETTDRTYRPARQARSRQTEEQFLRAAEATFAECGFARSRVADIISASGCSTGSFYHRFADKRELFDVMADRVYAYLEQRSVEIDLSRDRFGSIEKMLSQYADFAFAIVGQNVGFYRAAYEISAMDQEVWDRLKTLTLLVGQRVAEVAEQYHDEIAATDKVAALQHAVQIIVTLSIHTTLGSGPLFPDDPEELKKVVVRAALGVLR